MTSIAKLKDKARKHEQKEDWQAAIQVYQKVLEKQEAADDLELDLGLFNRIGDLNLRIGQTDAAVSYYETAADKYAESGFFNNAIALCNKALRHRPDRSEIYLKLSRLCNEQGFQTDARRWILEYAERQVAAGHVEEALTGLEEFADLSSDPEVRELLAQQLASHSRQQEAIGQLRTAYAMRIEAGQAEQAAAVAEKARAIDPTVDLEADGPFMGTGGRLESDGMETGTPSGAPTPAGPDEEAPGIEDALETTGRVPTTDELEADSEAVEGLETGFAGREPEPGTDADAVGGLETFDAGPDEEGAGVVEETEGLEDFEEAGDLEEEPEPLPFLDTGYEDELDDDEEVEPLPMMETGPGEPVEGAEPRDDEGTATGPEPAETDATGEEPPARAVAEEPAAEEAVEREPVEEPEPRRGPEPAAAEAVAGAAPTREAEAPEEPVPAEEEPELAEEEPEPVEEEPEPVGEPAPADEEPEPVAAADSGSEEDQPLHLSFEGGTVEGPGGVMEPGDEGEVEHPEYAMDFDMENLAAGLGAQDTSVPEALDVDAILDRSRELVSRGLIGEALHELHLLTGSDEGTETFEHAMAVLNEILRRDENHIKALQSRVEFATRIGDQDLLVDAYLDLADALAREGSDQKARVMYARALNLDPGNEAAREALGEAVADGDGNELNEMLDRLAPEAKAAALTGDAPGSNAEFAAMLEQFRAKVAEDVDPEEAGDHYDLGLAFKEMGLIDEAIAEFQVALTGGEARLKVFEELGQCFVLKGQHGVAVKVLNRALQVPHADEAELLGVYYHLGQCYEELGQREEARAAYSRVLSIDGSFEDVPDRMARL